LWVRLVFFHSRKVLFLPLPLFLASSSGAIGSLLDASALIRRPDEAQQLASHGGDDLSLSFPAARADVALVQSVLRFPGQISLISSDTPLVAAQRRTDAGRSRYLQAASIAIPSEMRVAGFGVLTAPVRWPLESSLGTPPL